MLQFCVCPAAIVPVQVREFLPDDLQSPLKPTLLGFNSV